MLQSIDTLIAFVVIMTVASLFVTILVQVLSAALSLRGKNLANALALTFQKIAPTLGDDAHRLAAKILTDPLLSDSTLTTKDTKHIRTFALPAKPWNSWDFFSGAGHLASAIRPEEVYGMLQRLSEKKELESGSGTKSATAADAAPADGADLPAAATKILEALAVPPHNASALHDAVDHGRAKFDTWFRSAQDRAQQWFQLHTRSLTIAASILIALLLQLDAVEIFHFVSTNAAARAALVSSAGSVIQQADGALDERGGLIKRVADAATGPGQAPIALAGVNHLGDLQQKLLERDGPSFNPAAYDDLVRRVTARYFAEQQDKLAELTRGANATGFEFIPVGYWRWPAGGRFCDQLAKIIPHLPGVGLFAALLTLGAPYWFNLLKNLASLRPALARAIALDDSSEKKPPA